MDARTLLRQFNRVLNYGQRAETEEIHLEQTQLLYRGHRKLRRNGTV